MDSPIHLPSRINTFRVRPYTHTLHTHTHTHTLHSPLPFNTHSHRNISVRPTRKVKNTPYVLCVLYPSVTHSPSKIYTLYIPLLPRFVRHTRLPIPLVTPLHNRLMYRTTDTPHLFSKPYQIHMVRKSHWSRYRETWSRRDDFFLFGVGVCPNIFLSHSISYS